MSLTDLELYFKRTKDMASRTPHTDNDLFLQWNLCCVRQVSLNPEMKEFPPKVQGVGTCAVLLQTPSISRGVFLRRRQRNHHSCARGICNEPCFLQKQQDQPKVDRLAQSINLNLRFASPQGSTTMKKMRHKCFKKYIIQFDLLRQWRQDNSSSLCSSPKLSNRRTSSN